ncbi:MAG TPA: sulfurtransferase TusA family protein [Marinagarivorans sp.]
MSNTSSNDQHHNGVYAEVDARGLSCPMPLLKAKLALNSCQCGQVVRVLATDAGSVRDFHAFANLSAHSLVHFEEHEGHFEYQLQKGEQESADKP